MPRGPYQGTYVSGIRQTVVTAPDALVYINGETDVIGCPSCRRKFDLNRYITSISVDLNVDSPPGSASINLSIPRHVVDDLYFEGQPVITSMMEVEIFAKGYYLVEGLPQYYPIFWGLITEVTDGYSSGEHTLTIQCADILKWWDICRMNINPAYTVPAGQAGRTIFGNALYGMNPYDVIWTLAQQSFGDVIIGTGSLVTYQRDRGNDPVAAKAFAANLHDISSYWESRFSRMRSGLLLYGVNGTFVRGRSLDEAYQGRGGKEYSTVASSAVRLAQGGALGGSNVMDPTDPDVTAFRTQFTEAGQVNFWQSEYQTKLEISTAAKEAIGFEFYMDVTGDLIFKPPFFNLDVLDNKPISWIQDIDIIDWDFSDSEAEVVTQLQMQGSFRGNVEFGLGELTTPLTTVTDYHLLRKYGWRPQPYNSEFMGSPVTMFYHGMDILDRINSKRHRGSVSIPMRPELRLGFPVYVAPKDQIWYVNGINHNISMHGRAQTTLQLTARRQKFIAPRGIGQLTLTPPPKESPPPKRPKNTDQRFQAATPDDVGNAFKYTARQLAKGGEFLLDIGNAEFPPQIQEQQGDGDNPYAPIILRHPKTGRLVGYPNVVMAYTRPYQPSPEQLKKTSGQGSGTSKVISQKEAAEIEENFAKEGEEFNKAQHTHTEQDDLREKTTGNRYSYGLNSAGAYTYAYDKEGVIGEITLLPREKVKLKQRDKSVKLSTFKGSSSMIRPVSDERGFEVIGHYRYGRGISLRDGRLLASNGGEKVQIDLPLALSGDLFATLAAQSAGLTTVATTAPNPASALSRLQPDDMQTAGVINPENNQPEFVGAGKTFMDTAPLNSPENKGFSTSVEATQLSRALTLAEMAATQGVGQYSTNDVCDCLLGRPELAFINIGTKVSLVRNTVPDTSSLFGVSGDDLTGIGEGRFDDLGSITDVNTNPDLIAAQNEGRPVFSNVFFGGTENVQSVSAKVNDFLYKLYAALDTPHQELERKLRGEHLEVQLPSADDVRFGQPNPTPGLRPPFSAPSRFAAGDPRAIAEQASSAKENIKSSWKKFSDTMEDQPKTEYYSRQISRLESENSAKLAAIRNEQSRNNPNETEIERLEKNIRDNNKALADYRKKLADIIQANP